MELGVFHSICHRGRSHAGPGFAVRSEVLHFTLIHYAVCLVCCTRTYIHTHKHTGEYNISFDVHPTWNNHNSKLFVREFRGWEGKSSPHHIRSETMAIQSGTFRSPIWPHRLINTDLTEHFCCFDLVLLLLLNFYPLKTLMNIISAVSAAAASALFTPNIGHLIVGFSLGTAVCETNE